MVTELDEFMYFWRGYKNKGYDKDWGNGNPVPDSVRHIEREIQEIMNNKQKSAADKRGNVIQYCCNTFCDRDNKPLGEAFKAYVGKMFDDTVAKDSSVKRAVQVTGAAVTKLVVGVIGLGVCIAGKALKVAGKVLDAATLGVVNKIPGLSSSVSMGLEEKNLYNNKNAKYTKARLNQVQILGSHLSDAGAKMMDLDKIAPSGQDKFNKEVAKAVKLQNGIKKPRSR